MFGTFLNGDRMVPPVISVDVVDATYSPPLVRMSGGRVEQLPSWMTLCQTREECLLAWAGRARDEAARWVAAAEAAEQEASKK